MPLTVIKQLTIKSRDDALMTALVKDIEKLLHAYETVNKSPRIKRSAMLAKSTIEVKEIYEY